METEMSDACVDQWSEQSTSNRKTRARIPAQVKASFFPQNDFKFFQFEFNLHLLRYKSLKLSTRTSVGNVSYLMSDK